MKKVIALIIVLGLPLVVTPAASSALQYLSCAEIKRWADDAAGDWLAVADNVEASRAERKRKKVVAEISLARWATIYQAFCKP